ncbi:DUF6177 family protein [Kocuria sp.]|uniref:DUF6177 family protein n=1 Tax=Kocuria sp. TaxID=1871328 RepID=UPI0026DFB807|nr:DUF6177 family protein [Kocuria sp.]MDO5619467.1 DUF6177 family protein [Kocuria sp.]
MGRALEHPAGQALAGFATLDLGEVFGAEQSVALFTREIRDFMSSAHRGGRLPLMVSGPDMRLSWSLAQEMERGLARWAIRSADGGLVDGGSGQPVSDPSQLWGPVPTESPAVGAPETVGVLNLEMFTHERADPQVQIGPGIETFVQALGSDAFEAWFLDEEQPRPWNAQAVTGELQRQMPRTQPVFMCAPSGARVRVDVIRQHSGLTEHVVACLPLPGGGDGHGSGVDARVLDALREVIMARRVASAVVSAGSYGMCESRLVREVGHYPHERPIAIVLSPLALRDYRIDIDRLCALGDMESIGPGRHKSYIIKVANS